MNYLVTAVLLEQNVMWSESVNAFRKGLEKLAEQRPLVTIRFHCAALTFSSGAQQTGDCQGRVMGEVVSSSIVLVLSIA